MNLQRASGLLRSLAFRAFRAVSAGLPARLITTFGNGPGKIGSILILNLDRQPVRWRRVIRELDRFKTSDGARLTSIATRIASVDARDGRAVAATADVDPNYRLGDQLYVQPDSQLEASFSVDEPVRMTRQEIAVARSHIEAWKVIAAGEHEHVLILEDDVWFASGAATAIERGWCAALRRCNADDGPHLLYLSYEDAGKTAERSEHCKDLFRPVRGLWFLSGYVLSREGASMLLRAMPVNGPVDMWMNYRFQELEALALSSSVIHQRNDGGSDNSYSVLPYLARAGIVDTSSGPMPPERHRAAPLLAWTGRGDRESLAMALSMLGLRVRVFDGDEDRISTKEFTDLTMQFDALVDAPLTSGALATASDKHRSKFILDEGAADRCRFDILCLPSKRTTVLCTNETKDRKWEPICALLDLPPPSEAFPVGALRSERMFRDDRKGIDSRHIKPSPIERNKLDDSPWVLPSADDWQPRPPIQRLSTFEGEIVVRETMTTKTPLFSSLVETFPGNLASFVREGVTADDDGTHLTIKKASLGERPYYSGAFASVRPFAYGRFEVEIKAAAGPGVVTGFFLHRSAPRQEIDIELRGNDPRGMLVNVYFNPGEEGTSMAYGYRGTPYRVDLGFDITENFHRYTINWRPGLISWSVDGRTVHERVGWDPTPIPHLPMKLHSNLWAPRSEDFAGRVNDSSLPARSVFRNMLVWE